MNPPTSMRCSSSRARARLLTVAAVALGLGTPAMGAPPCAEKVSSAAFYEQVASGDTAYIRMDIEAFQEARRQASQMIPCLDESLTPAQAAGYHRLEALGAFLGRDHAGAVASLRSVIAAAPGYQLSLEIAPTGHPLRMYFEIAEGSKSAPPVALGPIARGWVTVDGATSTSWPVDRPYLTQQFDSAGGVMVSALRTVGEAPSEELAVDDSFRSVSAKIHTARTLSLVSAGAALVTGALYLGARSSANQFWDPSTPTAELDALRQRTNALGWASAGVGLVAVGTGGAAVLVGTW